MRIIGEIQHPKYKITVLQMNHRITIQLENGLLTQSFTFRDGSGVIDLSTANTILTPEFLSKIDTRFIDMQADYITALQELYKNEIDDFEVI